MKVISQRAYRTMAALVAGCAFALSCSQAEAQQMVSGGWYPVGVATRINPGDGSGYFYFSSATSLGVTGCTQNGVGYAFSDAGSAASRNFALLMMAYSTGKSISIHLTGTCSGGTTGRPLVDTIEVTDVPYY